MVASRPKALTGSEDAQHRRRAVDDERERELLEADAVPGRAHPPGHVARGRVVPGGPGESVAAVPLGDLLERREVRADARR